MDQGSPRAPVLSNCNTVDLGSVDIAGCSSWSHPIEEEIVVTLLNSALANPLTYVGQTATIHFGLYQAERLLSIPIHRSFFLKTIVTIVWPVCPPKVNVGYLASSK